MAGITSAPVKALGRKKEPEPVAPGSGSNPEFITADDLLGVKSPRSTREASRFTQYAGQLVKTAPPIEPEQTTVKVPQLVGSARDGWTTTDHVLTGAVTLKVQRASKFRGKADVSEPSRQLAAFTQGEGTAWESFRDEDMAALLTAWAESVQPSAFDARNASYALALAMAARAGLAVQSVTHLGF
jgi:hypothetical protein